MRPRPEFVLAFLLTVLAALLNRPAERGVQNELPSVPPAHEASVSAHSFAGVTWFDLDDGTARGRENKESFFRAMRWIGIRMALIVGAVVLAAFVLARRFPPLPRKPPPHI